MNIASVEKEKSRFFLNFSWLVLSLQKWRIMEKKINSSKRQRTVTWMWT